MNKISNVKSYNKSTGMGAKQELREFKSNNELYNQKWASRNEYIDTANVINWNDFAWAVEVKFKNGGTNIVATFYFDKTNNIEKDVAKDVAENYAYQLIKAKKELM